VQLRFHDGSNRSGGRYRLVAIFRERLTGENDFVFRAGFGGPNGTGASAFGASIVEAARLLTSRFESAGLLSA
jgi:hypothetical protein